MLVQAALTVYAPPAGMNPPTMQDLLRISTFRRTLRLEYRESFRYAQIAATGLLNILGCGLS